MLLRRLWAALFVAGINTGALHAQSFDCRKAADATDVAICNSPELKALDTRLGATWRNFRTVRPDLVQHAKEEGVVWYKQRKLCSQHSDIVGCIRDAEVARIQQLNAAMTPIATTIPVNKSANDMPSHEERIGFGNHAGESAYVIAKDGVGTANASVKILMDWNRELRACSDEYLTYDSNKPDKDAYARCVAFARQSFKGPSVLTAKANCQTGELLSFNETTPRFYVGQIKEEIPADKRSGIEASTFYRQVFDYEGFQVGDYDYTGVSTDGEVFRNLCPASFTGPPKIDLPELQLQLDCPTALERAERIATESGVFHVMNLKVVDAWDVKNEGDTWFEAKCSANIMLNNGIKGRLEFKEIPRHGKYLIETHFETNP